MAAGIAHELNTPLNAIQGHVDLLEQLAEGDALSAKDVLGSAHQIEETVQKIATIIAGLRSIAKQGRDHEWGPFSLTKIIKDAVGLTEYHVHHNGVRLRLDIPAGDHMLEGNAVQISQVLINLINNAVDAVKRLQEKWIEVSLTTAPESYVLRVVDSGGGIPPQLAEKIMTPFFTTKKEGTGLGLSLSQAIVKRHGGMLRIDQKRKDTCFEVILPKPMEGGRR
jgi:two-component system CheB/CheR fusion protein